MVASYPVQESGVVRLACLGDSAYGVAWPVWLLMGVVVSVVSSVFAGRQGDVL
jgi:hypothetical protein